MIMDGRFIKHVINNDFLKQYYDNTENIESCNNVKDFLKLNINPGVAIDIGCGAGRDTKYLLKNGWHVIAIDKNNVRERISKVLNNEEIQRFEFQKQFFENLNLAQCDLVVANNSLSFCNKDSFNKMWNIIKQSINPGGYFVGNIFGNRDEWNNSTQSGVYFSKEDALNLFDEFNIISFEEVEKDGTTGEGKNKHWHYFDVIAKKK